MAVITKRDEKANNILNTMQNINDVEEFVNLFKQQYPDDFAKIQKTFLTEERKDKKGKGHPMPHPDQYLKNMYNVAIKKKENEKS